MGQNSRSGKAGATSRKAKQKKAHRMRSESDIDWQLVEKYCQAHCTGVDIAGVLGIVPLTLYRRCKKKYNISFDAYSAQKKGEGKAILRAKQFEVALDGSVPMQIWLGKQYLDQSDKQQTENSGTLEVKVTRTILNEFVND